MKKLLALCAVVAALFMFASCDKTTTSTADLPQKAQTALKTIFPKATVGLIKIESGISGKEYEVNLGDGTEVEFDSNGDWKEINGKVNPVPASVIPKPISDYVAANFSGQTVNKIEKKKNGYEIELSSGTDVDFDAAGHFLRVD